MCHMIVATVIRYLDQHSGAFTALLTLALVGVTIYYAIQNRRMVAEMREARNAGILPKLGLEFHRLGPTAMTVAIRNVGPGAALDVDIRARFEPVESTREAPEFRWRRNILGPGEQYDFLPPGDLSDNLNTLTAAYQAVRLEGSMRDAAGTTHVVDEAFDDLPEWRSVLHQARQRFTDPAPERRLAEALHNRFKQPLGQIDRDLQALTRVVSRITPPDESE